MISKFGKVTQLRLPIWELLTEKERQRLREEKRLARKKEMGKVNSLTNGSGSWRCTKEGCDRVFDTFRGLRIHEGLGHREKTQEQPTQNGKKPNDISVAVLDDGRIEVSVTMTRKYIFNTVDEFYNLLRSVIADENPGT